MSLFLNRQVLLEGAYPEILSKRGFQTSFNDVSSHGPSTRARTGAFYTWIASVRTYYTYVCVCVSREAKLPVVENRCAAPARTLRGHVSLFISAARCAGRDHVLLIQERYERPRHDRAAIPGWSASTAFRFVSFHFVSFRFCVAHAMRHTRNRDYPASVFHPGEPWSLMVSSCRTIGNWRGLETRVESCAPEQSSLSLSLSRRDDVSFLRDLGEFWDIWELHVHACSVWIIRRVRSFFFSSFFFCLSKWKWSRVGCILRVDLIVFLVA